MKGSEEGLEFLTEHDIVHNTVPSRTYNAARTERRVVPISVRAPQRCADIDRDMVIAYPIALSGLILPFIFAVLLTTWTQLQSG